MEKLYLIQHPIPVKSETPSKLLIEKIIAHINFNIEQMLPHYSGISHLTQTRKVGTKIQIYCQSSGLININDNTFMFLNNEKQWQEHKIPENFCTGIYKETLDSTTLKPWCKWTIVVDSQEKKWQGYLNISTPHNHTIKHHPLEWLDLSTNTAERETPINIMMSSSNDAKSNKKTMTAIKKPIQITQREMNTTRRAPQQPSSKPRPGKKNEINSFTEAFVQLWKKAHSPIAMLCHITRCFYALAVLIISKLWHWTPACAKQKATQLSTRLQRINTGIIDICQRIYGCMTRVCRRKKTNQVYDKNGFCEKRTTASILKSEKTKESEVMRIPQQCEKILTSQSDMLSLQS